MSRSRNSSVEYIYTAFITLKNGKQGILELQSMGVVQ